MPFSGSADPGAGSFEHTSWANMTRGHDERNPQMPLSRAGAAELRLDGVGTFS